MLRRAPRGPALALPSSPSLFRPCKSRRSMGLGNERAPRSKRVSAELFPGFYKLFWPDQLTVVNINNLDLAPSLWLQTARLFRRGTYGGQESTFYNPEWHGKSNLMSRRRRRTRTEAATVLKAAQIPPRLIQSLSAVEQEHKALSPWEE